MSTPALTVPTTTFPYPLQSPSPVTNSGNQYLTSSLLTVPAALAGNRLGEDVILTNVLSFDIRVFDPMAPVVAFATPASVSAPPYVFVSNDVLVPSDPGYLPAGTTLPSGYATAVAAGYGAFVDMGYSNSIVPLALPTGTPITSSPSTTSTSNFSAYPTAISVSSTGTGPNCAADTVAGVVFSDQRPTHAANVRHLLIGLRAGQRR